MSWDPKERHWELAHAMIDAIKELPEIQAWRQEKAEELARRQGREQPKWGVGGPEPHFEYRVRDVAVLSIIEVHCDIDGDVFTLQLG